MWSEESSDSDSDVETCSAAYSPNPLYEDRSISRPITPVTPKKSFFQASKDEVRVITALRYFAQSVCYCVNSD
jgi:hypothetical protein